MKELSIKEKAKRYDEAIENGKQILNTPYTAHWDTMKEVVEHLLPELKESKDEMIRKELLEHCKNQAKPYIQTGNECPQIQSWIDWLEKQGEKDNLSIDFVLGYLGIKPAYKDGNAWCILLGDNIQEGICGFGDTKEEALIAFIKELIEKQGKKKSTNSKEDDVRRVSTIQVLEYAKSLPDYNQFGKDAICKNIAWLEKQSEKPQGKSALEAAKEEKVDNQNCVKPVDEVEPKFKVGDFIVNDYCMGRIVEITNDAYLLDTEQGIPFSSHSTRLWDITKDANDGDVLSYRDGQWIFIYKGIVTKDAFKYYVLLSEKGIFVNDEAFSLLSSCITPATKEQRHLLFQEINKAGYIWNPDKKELLK